MLAANGTFFDGYDPFIKASMFNVFSTAALRIGHTLIRETFTLADGVRGADRLNESVVTFFDPAVLYELELGVNPYTAIYLDWLWKEPSNLIGMSLFSLVF